MVKYINPLDSVEWQTHRNNFENEIRIWCLKNNIGFFGTYQQVTESNFDKIIKLTVFELIKSFDSLVELDVKLGKQGKHLYYLTDNLVDERQANTLKNITIISIVELFGMISVNPIERSSTIPEKLFNCFIQRVDSVRQTWFYFLKHHNLLDKGYVSFLLFQYPFYSDKTGIELFDYIHQQYELKNLAHFDKAYQQLRPLVPYTNFGKTDNLLKYVTNSKYSLVLETYAVNDGHIGTCYTEKIHRTLQSTTIGLIFSQQYALTKLSNLGFKFNQCMLEIDQYPWIQRQQKILDILVNDSVVFDTEVLYNSALHNQNLILYYKEQFLKGIYLDKILTKVYET